MLTRLVRRVDNLRIGVRLGAVFVLCGLLIAAAFALDINAQRDAAQIEEQVEQAESAQQIADQLLIAINEISGWQGLYLADVGAFGVADALAEDDYNIEGYATSQQGIEDLFATMDRSALTADEDAIITEIEGSFDQFFSEDVKLRASLTERGLAALPAQAKFFLWWLLRGRRKHV